MRMLLTRLRPTTTTRRPVASRQLDHLLQAMHVRGEGREEDLARGAAGRCGPGRRARCAPSRCEPSCSTLVESDSSSSTPRAPYSAKAWMSGPRPSIGVWSILKSPVWTTTPSGVVIASADRVDDRVGHVDRFDRERPHLPALARPVDAQLEPTASRPCSRSRAVISPAAIGVAYTGTSQLAQHVRQRADVVLVAVRDDEAEKAVAELAQVVELRDDQIDAEHAAASGNITPQSMAIASPPYSSTRQLSPISPRPPSGMTRSGAISAVSVATASRAPGPLASRQPRRRPRGPSQALRRKDFPHHPQPTAADDSGARSASQRDASQRMRAQP